jgi:hypothetical protein
MGVAVVGNGFLIGDLVGDDGALTVSGGSNLALHLSSPDRLESTDDLALVAASFIGLKPGALPPAGRTVPKSHRSSSSGVGRGGGSLSYSSSSSEERLPCVACHLSCRSISSVRYVVFFAFRINGCFNSSLAEGRSRGSLLKQSSIKSLKGLLKLPSRTGGGFLGMRNRTFIGWMSEYGGSPLASSIAVIPSDQMSAL